MRKQYETIKETPELKIGAILEENCDDRNQDFHCISKDKMKFKIENVYYDRNVILKQSKWFKEIITMAIPKDKLAAVKKILAKK